MIVCKFGGTSVQDAEALTRVGEIVRGRIARRPIVVVSALGGATNQLLEVAHRPAGGEILEARGLPTA